MNFIKATGEPQPTLLNAYYYIFSRNHILVKEETRGTVSIPFLEGGETDALGLRHIHFLGKHGEFPCWSAGISEKNQPEGYKWVRLRALYGKVDDTIWGIAGYARQMNDWNRDFKFCGRCGTLTDNKNDENAKVCPACDLVSYPRISPAIITAVVKDDQLLLARGVRFPNTKMFSVLAGFVEPGESLEECVSREVFEETGIRVRDISYFKSQPWPFPDSLMIGFTARYDGGELEIDTREIVQAGWFRADNLPLVPAGYTLAGELIEWFVKRQTL